VRQFSAWPTLLKIGDTNDGARLRHPPLRID
jgi:hypothetical protein